MDFILKGKYGYMSAQKCKMDVKYQHLNGFQTITNVQGIYFGNYDSRLELFKMYNFKKWLAL